MEKHYGRTLYWFFHQWIDEPGFPAYDRSLGVDRRSRIETCVNVAQRAADEAGAPFRMPLDRVQDGAKCAARLWSLNGANRASDFKLEAASRSLSP
jgi:aminopeptidase N